MSESDSVSDSMSVSESESDSMSVSESDSMSVSESESERPVRDRKEHITCFLCHCFSVLYTGKLVPGEPSARHVERRLTILLSTPYLHYADRQTLGTDVGNIQW